MKAGDKVYLYNVYRPACAEIIGVRTTRASRYSSRLVTRVDVRVTDESHPFYRDGEEVHELSTTQVAPRRDYLAEDAAYYSRLGTYAGD